MRLRDFLLREISPGAHETGAFHKKLVGERRTPALMRHFNEPTLGTKGIYSMTPSWDDDGTQLRQMSVANFHHFNSEPASQMTHEAVSAGQLVIPHTWHVKATFGGSTLTKPVVKCNDTTFFVTEVGTPAAFRTASGLTVKWWNSPIYDPAGDDYATCTSLEEDASYVWLQEAGKVNGPYAHIPTKDSLYPAVIADGEWSLQADAETEIDGCVVYDPDTFDFTAGSPSSGVDHAWTEDFAGTPVRVTSDHRMILEAHFVAQHDNDSFMFQASGSVIRADGQLSPFNLSWYDQTGVTRTTSRTLIQYSATLSASTVYYSVNRDPAAIYGAIECATGTEIGFCMPLFSGTDQEEFDFVYQVLQTAVTANEEECVRWVGGEADPALTLVQYRASGSAPVRSYLNTKVKNAPSTTYFDNPMDTGYHVRFDYCNPPSSWNGQVAVVYGAYDMYLDFAEDFWTASWFNDSCSQLSTLYTIGPCNIAFGSYTYLGPICAPWPYGPYPYLCYTPYAYSFFVGYGSIDPECDRLSTYALSHSGYGPGDLYRCSHRVTGNVLYSSHADMDDYWDVDFSSAIDLAPGFLTLNLRRPFCSPPSMTSVGNCTALNDKLWWLNEMVSYACYNFYYTYPPPYGDPDYKDWQYLCGLYSYPLGHAYQSPSGPVGGDFFPAATFTVWLRLRCKTSLRELEARIGTVDAKGRITEDAGISHFMHSHGYVFEMYYGPPDPYSYGDPPAYDGDYKGRQDNFFTVPLHALAIAQGVDEDEYNTFMANSEDWEIIGVRVRPLAEATRILYYTNRCQSPPYVNGEAIYPTSSLVTDVESSFFVSGFVSKVQV
jgi:hypothetical protein